ncbi:hypothetical protein CVT24_002120 [Panaeolus cyanescens]|uniref:Peptidase S59 domain-containing protein n=1 Tax=Panaeolus cyanescens TaxID=181874 RepID=A0A409YHY7_9AGAR|nr:hypothetical protein CVT24_002120 [Panaeolus cyanescens]
MFGSSWANQNQNQQQQQTSTFGQPAAFGSTTNNAFGTTNTFGQPQQQPQVNPMFGNLGAPAAGTTTGFGTFGGGTTSTTPSAFGAKPNTGFGAFGGGGTSTFGSTGTTSAFGQPAQPQQTTSVFGQPATTAPASAFGSTSSLFGGNKPAFGATSASTTGSKFPVVTTGTASPPYAVTNEKEVPTSNNISQFQAIVSMEAYSGYSFEELRVQDYAQNRKTATSTGFGAPGAFGATTQPATTGVFGAQAAQPATTSIFGAAAAAPSTNAGFGTFGQNATQPATNTGSIFGGGTAFGQQNQQQPTSNAFGAFGQPQQQQQQPQQTSIFGNTQSAFGNTAKPATTGFGGFGTGAATTNTFGGGGGTFGSGQQQPAQTTGLFGTAQPANTTSAFSGFGTTAAKPSIFGSQPATQTPAPAFGAFGGAQQSTQPAQQTQQPSLFGGSSLFGNTQQQQQQQPQQNAGQGGTSLFGQPNATTTTTAAPSLFGNTNTGGSLFGNTQQAQQQQQQQPAAPGGGGLFGSLFNKPAQPTTSLFGQPTGNTNTTQTPQPNNLFSNTGNQTSSLFGNKPAAPAIGTSLSGNQTSLFGNASAAPAPQGTLVTSISQPISENVPLYSLLNSAPRILDLDQSQAAKKKAGFFVDIPTRSPVPRVQMGYTPANSKLRGFGSSTNMTLSSGGSPFNASVSFTSGKPNALVPNKSDARSSSIGPDFLGRSGSPALGSGTRQSVKKVILDKKVDPTELFVKSGSPGGLRSGKVTFSPALSVASREKDAAPTAPQVQESPTPAQRTRTPNKFTAQSTKDITSLEGDKAQSTELTEGDYYLKPDLPTLKKAGYDQLSSFEGLTVGRKGYGEIHFLEPVDLTGLTKLGALLGEVVRFDDKECSVYPDSEDVDKPPPGSGLNVKARLILEHCWAVDKASREPIKDVNHPHAVKHLKRLKNMKDTHFESFNIKTGTWTFTVDHF